MTDPTQAQAEGDELKPCPFCGGEANLDHLGDPSAHEWCVECPSCRLTQHADFSRDGAIAAWNRRAPPAAGGSGAGRQRLEERIHEMENSFGNGPFQDGLLQARLTQAREELALLSPPAAEGGLVEALRPFVEAAGEVATEDEDDEELFDHPAAIGLKIGDLKRAKTALAALARQGHAADVESVPAQAGGGVG